MDNSYNIIRIQQYLQGQLSPGEMHALEREALEDPFLNDAIEGYRLQREVNHGRLSLLQQRLASRIEDQRKERDRFFFGGQRLGIAATACVLFILVVVLFWMRSNLFDGTGEQAITKEVDVELLVPPNQSPSSGSGVVRISMSPLSRDGESVAAPVGGWEAFARYLQDHSDWSAVQSESLPVPGTTFAVGFEIDREGRPVDIRVDSLMATGPVALPIRQEITRLLKEGPVWKGSAVTLQVEFAQGQSPTDQ